MLPLLGVAISTGARHAAHIVTLIIDVAVIGGLCVYVTHKARDRDHPPTKWHRWGPTFLCWMAFPFVLADPLRHTLNDYELWASCHRSCHEKWPSRCEWSSEQYRCELICGEEFSPPFNSTACGQLPDGSFPRVDCECVHTADERITHLSAVGWLFTIIFTYFGFALFMVGNLWNANILGKCREIRHKYRVLRGLSESDGF